MQCNVRLLSEKYWDFDLSMTTIWPSPSPCSPWPWPLPYPTSCPMGQPNKDPSQRHLSSLRLINFTRVNRGCKMTMNALDFLTEEVVGSIIEWRRNFTSEITKMYHFAELCTVYFSNGWVSKGKVPGLTRCSHCRRSFQIIWQKLL